MTIYVTHAVEIREEKDNNRIEKILKNGILPAEWTGQTNYPEIGTGEYTSQSHVSYFSVFDKPKLGWSVLPEHLKSGIFLKNKYIEENPEKFYNGSVFGLDGRKIGYNNDPEDWSKNTEYFEEFCAKNKIQDYDYKKMSHAAFRRLVNQLVAKVPISPEAFEKVILFDEKVADLVVKGNKFNVPLYFSSDTFEFNKLQRI